ncbi:MAG: segregation/condensation protein A [Candidatus Micrarchaeota archaeon]
MGKPVLSAIEPALDASGSGQSVAFEHAGVILPDVIDSGYLLDLIDQPAWKTILLEIVRQEKMDPWNINVIELADKYLAKINALENASLRIPANAILACAILLKHKAKSLTLESIEDEMEAASRQQLTPEERALLAGTIPELREARSGREGRVSLDELVKTIEVMLNKSRSSPKFTKIYGEPNFVLPFSGFDIEQKMKEVLELVQKKADSQGLVLFSQLVGGDSHPNDVINVFVPLLFLNNNGKLALWQEEFWNEIFISLNKTQPTAE